MVIVVVRMCSFVQDILSWLGRITLHNGIRNRSKTRNKTYTQLNYFSDS